jgi:hypothetical protein
MTDAEQRIVEFLITSNATELADLPDWFLALLEGDVEGGVWLRFETNWAIRAQVPYSSETSVRRLR